MSQRRRGGLAFLDDRSAFVRRFVLAELLAPPRGKVVRLPHGPPPAPLALEPAPGSKK